MIKDKVAEGLDKVEYELNKKIDLYNSQKFLLDQFLKTGAIDKAQYDKSISGLKEKMCINGENLIITSEEDFYTEVQQADKEAIENPKRYGNEMFDELRKNLRSRK